MLYSAEEKFPVPGFKVLGGGPQDRVTIGVRVIDLYCVKPIDAPGLAAQVRATGGRIVTVEDHFAEGGLGEAVLAALATAGVSLSAARPLAVSGVPHSGKAEELLDAFGISARHIAAAAKSLL